MLILILIFYILLCVSSYFVFENHLAFCRSLGPFFLNFSPLQIYVFQFDTMQNYFSFLCSKFVKSLLATDAYRVRSCSMLIIMLYQNLPFLKIHSFKHSMCWFILFNKEELNTAKYMILIPR